MIESFYFFLYRELIPGPHMDQTSALLLGHSLCPEAGFLSTENPLKVLSRVLT